MDVDYCEVVTPSPKDNNNKLSDDDIFLDSNDAEYVAELQAFLSSENPGNYCEEELIIPDSTTEGYVILPSENNNQDKIESYNSYGENFENAHQIHIKEDEEVIDDSMVSIRDYSNDIDEITENESAAKLMPSQSHRDEITIIHEHNEEDEIRNANDFINRQKRNEIITLIRMYCTACINQSSNNGLPGSKKKCVKCGRLLKFKCLKCKERFKKYKTAYNHVKFRCIHETLLKCSKCNYTTLDERNLLNHAKQNHGNNQCSKCGEQFEDYATLKKHKIFQCKFKITKVKKKLDLYSYMEHFCKKCNKIISNGQRSFYKKCDDCLQYVCMQCTNCKHPCRNNMAAYTHLKFKCQALKLSCHQCNFKASKKSVLEKHLQNLHLPKKCRICNMVLSGNASLRLHMLELHKKQKAAVKRVKSSWFEKFCSECDKFLEKEKCPDCLQSGVLYQCKVCLKRYAFKSSIRSHYYSNHRTSAKRKESVVKCSICENMIPLKDLRNHMKKTHTIINCKKCGVKCENYDVWMKHKAEQCSFKDDDDDDPVKCSMCDFLTTNKDLEKHIKHQHTAIDCQRCGAKLDNYSTLKLHLRDECIFGDNATITCPTCNSLLKRNNFNKHMAEIHTFDTYYDTTQSDGHNCTLCGFIYTSAKKLTMHIKYTHNTWPCSQCGIECDSFYCMKKHQTYECISSKISKKVDNINVYCSKCRVAAKLIYALKVSRCSVCEGMLQFQCGVCKSNYKNHKGVKSHIRKVCNEKLSLPCPYCDHKETTESLFEIHIRKCIENSNQSVA